MLRDAAQYFLVAFRFSLLSATHIYIDSIQQELK